MSSNLSTLPRLDPNDSKMFKSTLSGPYKLKVTKVVDISKPAQRPVDEIEEPEEDEAAFQNKLNKSNARMIQLDLIDSNNRAIRALETERIELLDKVIPNCLVNIAGPVELRCGNMMLQKRHLVSLEDPPKESEGQAAKKVKSEVIVIDVKEDWDEIDEDEDDCIILD